MPLNLDAHSFDSWRYSKRNHFEVMRRPGYPLVDYYDLKDYQDALVYTFIRDNMPHGSRLLEVGGGDSRVLRALADNYECWNLDPFDGGGNGLTRPVKGNWKLVEDHIGDFSSKLYPDYFDLVFSISVFEHLSGVLADCQRVRLDIARVLRVGGWSLHAVDTKMIHGFHPIVPYMALSSLVPLTEIEQDPDLWTMPRSAYESRWMSVTKQSYEVFGPVFSYNLLWRREQ